MYSEIIPEEELRSRLKGREMTEDEAKKAMGICHLQGLDTTDKMDIWVKENRRFIASGKVPASEAASLEKMTDLVERFWLTTGLTLVLKAKQDGIDLTASTKEGQETIEQNINTCAFCGNSFIQEQGTARICPVCRLKANQDGLASIDPTGEGRKALKREAASVLIRWLVLIALVTLLIFIWYKFS
jgi:hypothetical protein